MCVASGPTTSTRRGKKNTATTSTKHTKKDTRSKENKENKENKEIKRSIFFNSNKKNHSTNDKEKKRKNDKKTVPRRAFAFRPVAVSAQGSISDSDAPYSSHRGEGGAGRLLQPSMARLEEVGTTHSLIPFIPPSTEEVRGWLTDSP